MKPSPLRDRRRSVPAAPSAARYLVVLVGIGLALGVTAVSLPAAGRAVRDGVCSSGSCAAQAIPRQPVGSCQVIAHADAVTDDAVIFTDDLGRSGRLTLSRTIDRSGVVHWFVRQDGGTGEGLDGRTRALLALGGGQLTEFADERTARDFVVGAQHEPVKAGLGRLDPTGLVHVLGDAVDGYTHRPRPPDAYFADAGAAVLTTGPAEAGVTSSRPFTGVEGIAEVKITATGPAAGTTVYYRLGRTVAVQLGLAPPPASAEPDPGGQLLASIGYDPAGRAERLRIEAAGELPGQLGPPFGAPGPAVMASLLSPGPVHDARRFVGRVVMSLSLANSDDRAVVADALHELGIPVLLDAARPPTDGAGATGTGTGKTATGETATGETATDGTGTSGAAVRGLYRLLDSGAAASSVTVNTYRPAPVGSPRPVAGLGLQGGLTLSGLLPAADYYYAPRQGFVRWQQCSG